MAGESFKTVIETVTHFYMWPVPEGEPLHPFFVDRVCRAPYHAWSWSGCIGIRMPPPDLPCFCGAMTGKDAEVSDDVLEILPGG